MNIKLVLIVVIHNITRTVIYVIKMGLIEFIRVMKLYDVKDIRLVKYMNEPELIPVVKMPRFQKIGHRMLDTEYYSEKFGTVVMDITNVENSPTRDTLGYIDKRRNKK